jgi:hypothetical protein
VRRGRLRRGERQGSTLWTRLPLKPTASSAVAPGTEADDTLRLHDNVLLVEDNPVNMLVAAATLEQWGICVAQARDGRMAIEAVREAAAARRPFDAVLVDVQMPVMSGMRPRPNCARTTAPRPCRSSRSPQRHSCRNASKRSLPG